MSAKDPGLHRKAWSPVDAILLGLLGVVLVATRMFQPTVWIDDAFIHFRNARNFVDGEGLLFNPGERLIGSTSPIYVLVLGVLGWVTRLEIPLLARGLNFTLDACWGLTLFSLLARCGLSPVFRFAIVLVLFLEPFGLLYSIAGMEMSLFIATSMLVVWILDRQRYALAGVPLGLLGWVRPEGALLGLAILLALATGRRFWNAAKLSATAGCVALITGAALYLYYGSVVPQSVVAKASGTWFSAWQENDARLFFEFLARLGPLAAMAPNAFTSDSGVPAAILYVFAVLQLIFILIGASFCRRHRPVTGDTLLYFLLLYFLFYAIANPRMFDWYYVPFAFLGTLLGGVGVWAVIGHTAALAYRQEGVLGELPVGWTVAGPVVYALVMALAMFNAASGMTHFKARESQRLGLLRLKPLEPFDRLKLYQAAGSVMEGWRDQFPEAVAATPEIGVFSWYYRGKVLDPYALVSREPLKLSEPGVRESLPPEVQNFHPVNVYVLHQPEFIMTAGLFLPFVPGPMAQLYEEVEHPEAPFLRLWIRKDIRSRIEVPSGRSNTK